MSNSRTWKGLTETEEDELLRKKRDDENWQLFCAFLIRSFEPPEACRDCLEDLPKCLTCTTFTELMEEATNAD